MKIVDGRGTEYSKVQNIYWTFMTRYRENTNGLILGKALHDLTHFHLRCRDASGPDRVEEPATHGFAVPDEIIIGQFCRG